ncbi:thiamine-phosphate kinase [Erwinia amylovora]|uniref:thiamine-phosphate kinase n=1 Tax=Erwinia amylovora TaxID=552 RepID=UPI000C083F0A|nr:thiamine-phosphate kinase [Erwinia amylovora]MBZ2398847.1 thiamine-phosphate kinase [Erwinia amylovora]MBZ2402773.1 thiamine-phosphate kinase [Erwinia amylovora]UDJ87635.1 thiamine-phosphate kinase [Erwinia amylovora]UDJ99092.1 thiamine-phosphate kinase [Erwinia amylovora]UDK88850.1 thiamine-phosphate kinase [Erwinia amylovora]
MACGEFELIARYFNRASCSRRDVEQGIGDDCALLSVPEKQTLAISTDTLVEGVHFLRDIHPGDLAYKALAVNLSDLAAMGADPAWLTLALTLPEVNESWLKAFSDSLFELLDYYHMQLIGGDTTRGPLSMTLGVHGMVPQGRALKRSGARIGDWIYVTGTLGDSAAGLELLQHRVKINDPVAHEALIKRHLRPMPRVLQGQALRDLASSAIDLSDGLISDLGHILQASACGARVNLDALPLSAVIQQHFAAQQALSWALSGGEDYELCFTVPEINRGALDVALGYHGVPYTCIGQIAPQSDGLTLWQNDQPVDINLKGFDHFAQR